MKHAMIQLIALVPVMLLSPACDNAKSSSSTTLPAAGEKLTVAVSIQPQIYFVQRIGGDRVDVHSVLSPGQSHGAFDPSGRQMERLKQAKAFFRIGVAFESVLIAKLRDMSPTVEVIDTRDGIQLLHLSEHHHDAAPGESHDHAVGTAENGHVCGDNELDPHIWLDPDLVRVQAKMICAGLKQIAPQYSDEFNRNLVSFDAELVAMDARFMAIFKPFKGRAVLVFHPSFAYFCKRYGLKQLVIESEGKEPGPRRLSELIQAAKAADAKVVFSQAEYSSKSAEAIAEAIGGRLVLVAPQSPEWAANLETMARLLADSFASGRAD